MIGTEKNLACTDAAKGLKQQRHPPREEVVEVCERLEAQRDEGEDEARDPGRAG